MIILYYKFLVLNYIKILIMDKDYKSTIYCKTNFSMGAGLPNYEPKVLEWWDQQNIYEKIRLKK